MVEPQTSEAKEPLSLSLRQAVSLAESTSERVVAASAGLAGADPGLEGARAQWLPELYGSVSYTRTLASQFDSVRGGDETPTPGGTGSDCAPFVPAPGLPVSDRIDALGRTLECVATSAPDLGSSFEDLPFGRENQEPVIIEARAARDLFYLRLKQLVGHPLRRGRRCRHRRKRQRRSRERC